MIISFYSYKGGVGRTQLCANVAAYLSIYKNKKVLLWDWDFEAPGLHVYYNKKNEEIESKGTIELLDIYVRIMRSKNNVQESDLPYLSKDYFTTLIPETTECGRVDLLPAGNYSGNFAQKVNNFNWQEFYELLDGVNYIELLKKQLNDFDYDYVFIDSRTGISDYSGICNIQLPELTILMMTPNEQNFAGCSRIAKQIIESDYVKNKYRNPWIMPILSRLDLNNKTYPEWIKRFTTNFSYLLPNIDTKIDTEFITEIFEDIYLNQTLLEYNTAISTGENKLFVNANTPIIKVSFERKFVNIAQFIENLNESYSLNIYNQIDSETWLNYACNANKQKQTRKEIIAYANAGDYKKANELGGTASSWFEEGNNFMMKNDQIKSIECYLKAIKIKPDFQEALFNLGNAYYFINDIINAIEYLKKALEILPTNISTLLNLGIMYSKNEENINAIECFQKIIELESNNVSALNNIGFAFIKLGEIAKAENYLLKSIDLGNKFRGNMNVGHVYFCQGNKEMAFEKYKMSFSNSKTKESFFVDYDDDFKYLEKNSITKKDYDFMKDRLIEYSTLK